jgi:hypothetical protein
MVRKTLQSVTGFFLATIIFHHKFARRSTGNRAFERSKRRDEALNQFASTGGQSWERRRPGGVWCCGSHFSGLWKQAKA